MSLHSSTGARPGNDQAAGLRRLFGSTCKHFVALAHNEVEHHDRLARLYDREGAWAKAAGAFERVAELARDDRARAALRAAGRIYREHQRPEKAIDVYSEIVAKKPSDLDAWRALDDLLSGLGRWREVGEVRGELAARTTSGSHARSGPSTTSATSTPKSPFAACSRMPSPCDQCAGVRTP